MNISFEDLIEVLQIDVNKRDICIEILFSIDNYDEYNFCWMGKLYDHRLNCDVYWFGLVHDGTQGYDFDNIDDFINAKVFYNKSLFELRNHISIETINGLAPLEAVEYYRNLE